MTPDPTLQHDHGAAGFCTDHGQAAPDERVETVARVLRAHRPKHEWHSVSDAAHVAAAVVAALDDETARLREALRIESQKVPERDRIIRRIGAERDDARAEVAMWQTVMAAHTVCEARDAALNRVRAEMEMVRGYAALDFATAAGVVLLLDKFAAAVTDTPAGAHLRVPPRERYDAVLDSGPEVPR